MGEYVTKIGVGPNVTSFGYPYDAVTGIGKVSEQGIVGSVVALPLLRGSASVAASQTNLVIGQVKLPFKAKPIALLTNNATITGTASVNLYNATDAASIAGALSLSTGATANQETFEAAQSVLDKGDVVQLRVTTAGASGATELAGTLLVQILDAPVNLANR